MESQCLGLADALAITPAVKRVQLRPFWRAVTPYLRLGGYRQFAAGSDLLTPPWPDLLIGTGRQSVAAVLWVKKASGGKVCAVQLQNPGFAWRKFDLIVAPQHDRLSGANVIATRGSLHRATRETLARDSARWSNLFAHLPRPYIAVLIGGSNSAYHLGTDEIAKLCEKLSRCSHALGGSVLVTPSRRTSPEAAAAIAPVLAGVPHFLWNTRGDNPYFGLLGLADFIVVTCDSVNMISEAASTGKPVYVEMLPGGSSKSARFLDRLRAEGAVRNFTGTLEPFAYVPINDMPAVVERITQLLRKSGIPGPLHMSAPDPEISLR